jgi:hypothetical protein
MIVVSTLTYGLGKVLGIELAAKELARQLSAPPDPNEHFPLPCVLAIRMLQSLDSLMLYHGASTTLPKARSRAAHAALQSDADMWAMIDDDVCTDIETMKRLVAIARSGRVAVLPCAVRSTRSDHRVNVQWLGPLVDVHGGVATRGVRRAGCGLMIVPHVALERVTEYHREDLSYYDDDGERRVALFQQMFFGGGPNQLWLGEDYSFCERLRHAGVEICAPVEGSSVHDNVAIDLADAAALP